MSMPETQIPNVFDAGQQKMINISLAQYLGLEAALAFENQDKINGTLAPIHVQLARTCGMEIAIALSQYEAKLLEMQTAEPGHLLQAEAQHWMPVEAVKHTDFYQTLSGNQGFCRYHEADGISYFLIDHAHLSERVNGETMTRQCGPILKRLGLPSFFSHQGIDELEMLLWGIVETACRPVDWEAIDCIMPGDDGRKRQALQRLLERGILSGDDDAGYRCYYYAGVEEHLERKGFTDLCRCRA